MRAESQILTGPGINRRRLRGVSLVELMVAMVVSLVLLGGALALFAGTRGSYETIDQLSRVQENGRFALDKITRDLRSAGYVGCAKNVTRWRNALNSSTDLAWNFANPLQGFDGTSASAWTPALDASIPNSTVPLNDVLVVRIPEPGATPARVAALMTSGTSDLVIQAVNPAPVAMNDVVMVSDCEAQAFFEVTNYSVAAGLGTISHAQGSATSTSPGNASGDLVYAFQPGAEVIPFVTRAYFLAPSTAGTSNALWRKSGISNSEELIEGVDGMQLLFGRDTNGDLQANDYVPAGSVTDWTRVVSVRVALLLRSVEQYGSSVDNATYALLDPTNTVGPFNDRRIRQVFTTTVTLRNRTL